MKSLALILLSSLCASVLAQSDSSLAITGARIIDGSGTAPIEDGVLLIENDRVAAIGTRDEVDIPSNTKLLDARGKTLMPGMINAHGHAAQNTDDKLAIYARYGVTTVLSLGGENNSHVALRNRQQQEGTDGSARLLVAGPIPGPGSVEDARDAIRSLADMNVDWVKIRVQGGSMPEPVYAELIAQAHRQNLPVAAHMYNLDDTRRLVTHEVDMLAHSVRDQAMDSELLEQMKAQSTCLSPTLMREVSTYVYASTPDFFSDPFFLQEANPADLESLQQANTQQRAAASLEQGQADLAMAQHNLKLAYDAGVNIAMGTDSGAFTGRFPGYFEHLELELMVDAGMSPADVIHAATGMAASCIGVGDELGTLSPGKRADFIILNENPLEDIHHTRTIESVWIGGKQLQE